MPNLLAAALGKPDTTLNRVTAELELASGYPSEDSRLISDLAHSVCWQMAELGLDPQDSTAYELHQTLLNTYSRSSLAFAEAIGESPRDSLQKRYERLGDILARIDGQGEVWALKKTALTQLLKANPPKKVLKQLGYRSMDSMLKRGDPSELFTAAAVVEPDRWLKAVNKYISGLDGSHFEARQPTCLILPERLWSGAASRRPLVFSQPEIGIVAVWPNQLADKTTTLGVLALVLRQLENLHNISASLDTHYLRPDLGKLAVRKWGNSSAPAFTIGGLNFSWRSLCGTPLQAAVEPSSGRLPAIGCRQSISRLHPALRWWADNEYLIFVDGKGEAVSMNIVDVAVNHALGTNFPKRTLSDARSNLTDELATRYLQYIGGVNFIGDCLSGGSKPITGRKSSRRANLQLAGTN